MRRLLATASTSHNASAFLSSRERCVQVLRSPSALLYLLDPHLCALRASLALTRRAFAIVHATPGGATLATTGGVETGLVKETDRTQFNALYQPVSKGGEGNGYVTPAAIIILVVQSVLVSF